MFNRYQINTAKGILDTILSVQPKEGGSQGGETRESIVYRLADDMLDKLPPPYNNFEVVLDFIDKHFQIFYTLKK